MSELARKLAAVIGLAGLAAGWARAEAPVTPPGPASPAPAANAPGPKIKFEMPVFDFGKVKSGEPVKYSYVFSNVGDTLLEVTQVQPSCGCTTAGDWSRQVEPGKTGTIPVQFNSLNFNGPVYKTITVNCNDRTQPTTILQLKGTVWKPIEVVPSYAVLTIPPDAPSASTVVRIVNNTDEPMDILSEPESNNKGFAGTLMTNRPGKEYQLTIATVPPIVSGTVQSQITIRTTSTNTPVLTVPFYANVQPAVVVSPNQVVLPIGPLPAAHEQKVTIQCNSTNAIQISGLALDVLGASFALKEIQPGKMFEVALSFPAGLELIPGQQVYFTARCSHPNRPEIRIPILQPARPAPPQAVPPPTTVAVPRHPAPAQPPLLPGLPSPPTQ